MQKWFVEPPEWHSGLKHCITVLRHHYSLGFVPSVYVLLNHSILSPIFFIFSLCPLTVKTDPSQKPTEDGVIGTETTSGLGPDLTASVETTYSEQSSSSSGSTSSTDQPIYFR